MGNTLVIKKKSVEKYDALDMQQNQGKVNLIFLQATFLRSTEFCLKLILVKIFTDMSDESEDTDFALRISEVMKIQHRKCIIYDSV